MSQPMRKCALWFALVILNLIGNIAAETDDEPGWAAAATVAKDASDACLLKDARQRTWDKPMALRLQKSKLDEDKQSWDGAQPSGPGSRVESTTLHRAMLSDSIRIHRIKSFVDVPCGDMTWIPLVNFSQARYYGGDISPSMIAFNKHRFADGSTDPRFSRASFDEVDLTCNVLPLSQMTSPVMIHCKDVLFHMSTANALRILRNFEASTAQFLVTTTHNVLQEGQVNNYTPQQHGDGAYKDGTSVKADVAVAIGYHQIDLRRPPFCFGEPLVATRPHDGHVKGDESQLHLLNGVWKLPALGTFEGNRCTRYGGGGGGEEEEGGRGGGGRGEERGGEGGGGRGDGGGTGRDDDDGGGGVDVGRHVVEPVIYLFYIQYTDNTKHNSEFYRYHSNRACSDLVEAGVAFGIIGTKSFFVSQPNACMRAVRIIDVTYESLRYKVEANRNDRTCAHLKFGLPVPEGQLQGLARIWLNKLSLLCKHTSPSSSSSSSSLSSSSSSSSLLSTRVLVDAGIRKTNSRAWAHILQTNFSSHLYDLTKINSECYSSEARFGETNTNRDTARFKYIFGRYPVSTTNIVNANYLIVDTRMCGKFEKAFDEALEIVSTNSACPCFDEEIVMSRMYLTDPSLFHFPRGCIHT